MCVFRRLLPVGQYASPCGYCPLGNTPRRAAIARWAIRRRGVLFRFAQYARLARLCAHFVARIRLAVRPNTIRGFRKNGNL